MPFAKIHLAKVTLALVCLVALVVVVSAGVTVRLLHQASIEIREHQSRLDQGLERQRVLMLKMQEWHEDLLLADQRLPAYSPEASELFGKAAKVDCRTFAKPRSAVVVILGQSNAGNYGEIRSPNRHGADIANYFGQQCAVAAEPLMGSDGIGGSPWVALANAALDDGIFDRMLLVPVTLGGTGMTRWNAGGDLYSLAETTLRRLALAGIPPTHVFWVQGEAERADGSRYRRNGGNDYFDGLQAIVNLVRRYSQAKVFVSPTSSCRGEQRDPAPEIRWAQTEIVRENSGVVFSGPDLDAIDRPDQRTEGCHLSEAGMTAYVSGWFAAIQAVEPAAR